MTDASPAPVNPTTTTEAAAPQPAPAPQLSRRQSGTKVGSRVPSLAIATSGEGCPDTPSYTPVAGTPKSTPKGKEVRIATKITESGKSTPKARVAPLKSSLKGSGASTPNAGGGGTPREKGEALKLLSLSSLSSPHASLTSPPRHYRARSRPEADDGVPAAGLPYTSRYAVTRSTLRSIAGKSQSETDVLSLKPLPADYSPIRGRSKRVMDAAYSPTQLAYSNEESRQFQLDQRLGGKRTNAPHSAEAPWEHSQYKPASPKRAGSARPTVFTGNMPPWDRDNDATHNRSTRSHSCGAALRTREAPFGVTAGSDGSAFKKGDTKVIQGARAAGARPSTGRSTSRTPADHDILNPHGPEEKLAPSGRRPPPASSLEPSLEYVRPYSRKQVAEVEHTDRPQGKRGNAMATAPSEGSPFRTANDDLRFASLSSDQSAMGPQATNPPKAFSKVFYDGRSGGVQSFHIDPTNAGAVNSKFSPPRERPPTAKRNQSNIESAPGTDVDSLTKVCPVRYNRNKETLVGVMHPVPLRAVPQYDVVPPFATEAY